MKVEKREQREMSTTLGFGHRGSLRRGEARPGTEAGRQENLASCRDESSLKASPPSSTRGTLQERNRRRSMQRGGIYGGEGEICDREGGRETTERGEGGR